MSRLPPAYGQKIRRKMQAGCEVEDLRIRTPFFYDVAGEIQPYLSENIATFAESTFRARYKVTFQPCFVACLPLCFVVPDAEHGNLGCTGCAEYVRRSASL